MPKTLSVLNDPPYGTERSYNGLRLAGALSKRENEEVKVFLMGDAAACARKGQKVPQGYYNLEVMLRNVSRNSGEIGVCATCMEARGIADTDLTGGAHRSSLEELTNWVQWAERLWCCRFRWLRRKEARPIRSLSGFWTGRDKESRISVW